MGKHFNPYLFIGLIGLCTVGIGFGINLYQIFYADHNHYWTPYTMQLPFDESTDRVIILINQKPLQRHLENNQLFIHDQSGEYQPVSRNNIRFQFNNWYEVKSNLLTTTVFIAVLFGCVLMSLVIGVIELLTRKNG